MLICINEGIGQVLFFESDEDCDTSYEDRGGKYQGSNRTHLFAPVMISVLIFSDIRTIVSDIFSHS